MRLAVVEPARKHVFVAHSGAKKRLPLGDEFAFVVQCEVEAKDFVLVVSDKEKVSAWNPNHLALQSCLDRFIEAARLVVFRLSVCEEHQLVVIEKEIVEAGALEVVFERDTDVNVTEFIHLIAVAFVRHE